MPERLPPSPPETRLPTGSCDCHMHAYSDRYPAPPHSPFRPVPGGDIETYMELRRLLGLMRAIVVQPSAYGTDNSCTLDAVARLEDGRAVIVVGETVQDGELERLTAACARGLRFFMRPGGALDKGKFLEPVGLDHSGFRALCDLLDSGQCWVKTSGVYETPREGPPDDADVAPLARELIRRFPEPALWATNRPHPSKHDSPPNDARLVDLFAAWCGSDELMRRILVANPATVYGFRDGAS